MLHLHAKNKRIICPLIGRFLIQQKKWTSMRAKRLSEYIGTRFFFYVNSLNFARYSTREYPLGASQMYFECFIQFYLTVQLTIECVWAFVTIGCLPACCSAMDGCFRKISGKSQPTKTITEFSLHHYAVYHVQYSYLVSVLHGLVRRVVLMDSIFLCAFFALCFATLSTIFFFTSNIFSPSYYNAESCNQRVFRAEENGRKSIHACAGVLCCAIKTGQSSATTKHTINME